MSQISEITTKIIALNSTLFQEMCDEIVLRENPNYKDFGRSGKAIGKEETKPGTPDSYILLSNDKYVFIESTKDNSKGKLKGDFDKCINFEKTGISKDRIQTIAFCVSYKLSPAQSNELNNLCNQHNITMDLWSIDRLSRNILYQNPDLGNKYLDIPLDKSQWVRLKSFIDNYNSAGKQISTPLDNPFFHREKEIDSITESIKNHHLTIVSGVSGSGKSKIVVEILNRIERESSVQIWVNSFDSDSITEDLIGKLSQERDTVLFIDDAHRVSHFQQILRFLKNSNYKKVKLIVTVRDYAEKDFNKHIFDYDTNTIKVDRLSDTEITDILKSEPFGISEYDVIRKILKISQGNIRLCLMLVRIHEVYQDIDSLNDVGKVFDFYFNTFLYDSDDLNDPDVIRIMAFLTFFGFTDMYSEDFVNRLKIMNIEQEMFYQKIGLLNKMELVSIYNDEIKVVEQNLGIYFFDKAFFKLDLLSFTDLLENYFTIFLERFKDCIISVNNNFSHENLVKKTKHPLIQYANQQDSDLNKFFELFWFIIPDKALEYIFELSTLGTPIKVREYNFQNYDNRISADENSDFFKLVIPFLKRPTIYLKNTIQASFEYVRRNPKTSQELISIFREYLSIKSSDVQYGFYRQSTLLEVILDGISNNRQLEKEVFYPVGIELLKHTFQNVRFEYDNTFYLDHYTPKNSSIKEIRETVWKTLYDNFNDYPNLSIELMMSCARMHPDNSKELMSFDIERILTIISKKLNPNVFEHCRYVHEQIWWCRRCKVDHKLFDELLQEYVCDTFELYQILDRSKINKSRRFEIDERLPHLEYKKLKNEEIQLFIIDKYIEDVEQLYYDYECIKKSSEKGLGHSFDVGVSAIYDSDIHKGNQLLEFILERGNVINYIPYWPFGNMLDKEAEAITIFEIISRINYSLKTIVLLVYFERLQVESLFQVNSQRIEAWAEGIQSNESFSIYFDALIKYTKYEQRLFEKILPILTEKIVNGTRVFIGELSDEFINSLKSKIDILKSFYLVQDICSYQFDYDNYIFKKICEIDSNFLLEYFKIFYDISSHYDVPEFKSKHENYRDNYSFIWDSPVLIVLMSNVLDLVIEKEYYLGINDHKIGIFFENLSSPTKEKAVSFLKDYMRLKTNSPKHLNAVMDVINKKFPNLQEEFIKYHLSINKSKNVFEQVYWIYSQGIWSGNDNPALIRSKRWKKVIEYINSMDDELSLIPIKNLINEKIEYYKVRS